MYLKISLNCSEIKREMINFLAFRTGNLIFKKINTFHVLSLVYSIMTEKSYTPHLQNNCYTLILI